MVDEIATLNSSVTVPANAAAAIEADLAVRNSIQQRISAEIMKLQAAPQNDAVKALLSRLSELSSGLNHGADLSMTLATFSNLDQKVEAEIVKAEVETGIEDYRQIITAEMADEEQKVYAHLSHHHRAQVDTVFGLLSRKKAWKDWTDQDKETVLNNLVSSDLYHDSELGKHLLHMKGTDHDLEIMHNDPAEARRTQIGHLKNNEQMEEKLKEFKNPETRAEARLGVMLSTHCDKDKNELAQCTTQEDAKAFAQHMRSQFLAHAQPLFQEAVKTLDDDTRAHVATIGGLDHVLDRVKEMMKDPARMKHAQGKESSLHDEESKKDAAALKVTLVLTARIEIDEMAQEVQAHSNDKFFAKGSTDKERAELDKYRIELLEKRMEEKYPSAPKERMHAIAEKIVQDVSAQYHGDYRKLESSTPAERNKIALHVSDGLMGAVDKMGKNAWVVNTEAEIQNISGQFGHGVANWAARQGLDKNWADKVGHLSTMAAHGLGEVKNAAVSAKNMFASAKTSMGDFFSGTNEAEKQIRNLLPDINQASLKTNGGKNAFDLDGDGKADLDEVIKVFKNNGMAYGDLMKKISTDGNQNISKGELEVAMKQVVAKENQKEELALEKALGKYVNELNGKGWAGHKGKDGHYLFDGDKDAKHLVDAKGLAEELLKHGYSLASLDRDHNGLSGKEITNAMQLILNSDHAPSTPDHAPVTPNQPKKPGAAAKTH